MRAGSPAIPGLNKLAGEVVEVTLTLSSTFKVKVNRLLKWYCNCMLRTAYPYPQSGALTIYDCMRPALRKGYLMPKKRFLKDALKGVLEGCLIK